MPSTTVESVIEAELAALDFAPIAILGPNLADTDEARIDAGLAAFFRANPDPSRIQIDAFLGSREDRRRHDGALSEEKQPGVPIIVSADPSSAIEVEIANMNVYLDKLGVQIAKLQIETDMVALDDHLAVFVAANPMPDVYGFNTWNATPADHMAYYRCLLGIRRMDDELAVIGLKRR